jgi:hypothetical protein
VNEVNIIFRPLSGVWPDDGRTHYESCRFRAKYSATLGELKYELCRLGVDMAVIELDLTERDIRLDGLPRANATPESPRVRISFEHPDLGALQYPCDTYSHWQDNLRAIAKTLEAQRAMDRYGATRRNQQYAGWQQLPPGGAAMQTAMTVEQAAAFINDAAGRPTVNKDLIGIADNARLAYRSAAAKLHPDRGGDASKFNLLQEAKRVLFAHHGIDR